MNHVWHSGPFCDKLDIFQVGLYRRGADNCYVNGETTVCEQAPANGEFESLAFPEGGNLLMHATVLPAMSDSEVMFCLQSYQGLIIDRPLVY